MYRKLMILTALAAAFAFTEIDGMAQGTTPPVTQGNNGQSQSQTLPPNSNGNNHKGKGVKKRVRKHIKRRRHPRIKATR